MVELCFMISVLSCTHSEDGRTSYVEKISREGYFVARVVGEGQLEMFVVCPTSSIIKGSHSFLGNMILNFASEAYCV